MGGRDVPEEERLREMNYLDAMNEYPVGEGWLRENNGAKLQRTVDFEVEAQGKQLLREADHHGGRRGTGVTTSGKQRQSVAEYEESKIENEKLFGFDTSTAS